MLEEQIRARATTLQRTTVQHYGCAVRRFLFYLHRAFPEVHQLSQLRRDPHMLGWFRSLCEHPPMSSGGRRIYLAKLRCLLDDLVANGHALEPGLILARDFPRRQVYLPRPLTPEDDKRLQRELRKTDDLYSNALLLIRATGIRLSECVNLRFDCLRPLDRDQWALHIPLGKLRTERLVPVDKRGRALMARLLAFRASPPNPRFTPERSGEWLLPRIGGTYCLQGSLRDALTRACERAGCSHASPHQLRHTFATEMIRLGVSLPALMQLMGHKDLRMTMRYVQVTQKDLQREFHLARKNAAHPHVLPSLPVPTSAPAISSDLPGIRQSLAATRHLLEMYRRQLADQNGRRKLQRLDKRLLTVALELDQFTPPGK